MAYKPTSPKVKEWVQAHPNEVELFSRRYRELNVLPTTELLDIAKGMGLDFPKLRGAIVDAIVGAEMPGVNK